MTALQRPVTALLILVVIGCSPLLSGCGNTSKSVLAAPDARTAAPGPLPVATTPPAATALPAATPTDDLVALSDEFNDSGSLSAWHNHSTVEGWPSQIETLDINQTNKGELYLVPYTSTWFDDFRGPFLFKEISGDFDVRTRIQASGKGSIIPRRTFSLTGLMVRAPRDITMQTWQPGKENWLFITTGYGDDDPRRTGKPQIETKTTTNSRSNLTLILSRTGWVELRIVRSGATFLMLYRFEGGAWTVSKRFVRPDLPATLQVGLNAYTNWDSIPQDAAGTNRTVLTAPRLPADLIVRSDYVRFQRPHIPTAMKQQVAAGTADIAGLLKALGD